MMGLQSGGSEFGNLFDMLALVDDKAKYEAKLKELDARIKTAQTTLEQAAEQNRQAQTNRTMADSVLEQAHQKVAEAKAAQAENQKAADDLAEKAKQQQNRENKHALNVASVSEQHRAAEATLAERQKAVAAQENDAAQLHSQTIAKRDEILNAAAAELEKAKTAGEEVAKQAAILAGQRKDFQDFIARMKGWEFTQ